LKIEIDITPVYFRLILLQIGTASNVKPLVEQPRGCGSVFWIALRERAEAAAALISR
jgi:hypothetical protein